ncbi:response regulator [Fusibacter tunisiensis]|uniref:Stage 0 sporulation protein A homolog n=1 Tax=Fusibacter tunisiensis TaxID=1008308 RepID=A0ABS2MMZ5_9FIRM|nr:response regulator [Fusibacter tunisiensis]MBM7560772.1 two-component system chemotaxis response regulator CheY [Fusibacter tunisiensis]
MGKRILIVDDAVFMRKLLGDVLNKAGYEVVGEASNGGEALEKYRDLKPDLVTMDITMPEVDGIEGLKRIKKEFPDATVLMCSAMGQESMVIDSVKSGARGFIVKPFVADKVIYEVSKLIG